MPEKQPNILLVMADQLADPWLDLAVTPVLDQLAAEGVRFTNAYSNSPLCAPARFAMMSGRLCSSIGAHDNASLFAADIPTFAFPEDAARALGRVARYAAFRRRPLGEVVKPDKDMFHARN